MALAAVRQHDGQAAFLGVARYYLDLETGSAEFAVVVGDAWQGHGLGPRLMECLIAVARQRGVRRLVGQVLRENGPMLKMCAGLGFRSRTAEEDPTVMELTLELEPPSSRV
jgi:acetyltransferase